MARHQLLQTLDVQTSAYMTGGEESHTTRSPMRFEVLWEEFFRDPSSWWDNRGSKRSPSQPDFRHKLTKEPLWMTSVQNPSWVRCELKAHGFAEEQCIGTKRVANSSPASLIWACCKNKDLSEGIRLHNELQKQGISEKDYSDALATMYAKCGELQKAQALLDKHNSSKIIPWTALILGYVREGQAQKALDCFDQLHCKGIAPNPMTYASILKACAMIGNIEKGRLIHDEISRQGLLEHDIVIGGALVDMYAKCGALLKAESVLKKLPSRNVITWNALMGGYAQKGQVQQALESLKQMQHEKISPTAVTYVCILKACAMVGAVDKGKQIHDEILRQGMLEHNIILGGALVDMYAKCGALAQAQSVSEKLPSRNVISWGALIGGYVQKRQGQQALKCFEQMLHEGISPNAVTYVSILNACAVTGAIDRGKQIHNEISRQGLLEKNVELGSALVDMYAKCGDLLQAQSVLEKLPSRNVISWNALIAGYAQEGQGEQALRCFEQMQHEGFLPDIVTFLCLLNLCSHLGLVEKGQELLGDMGIKYGLVPDVECFTCIIDLLGRAGHLVKAVEVIQEMPFPPSSPIWHCLLGACWKWTDVNLGTWAFEQAVELDKCDGAAYVLMVNIYRAAGMPNKAKDIEAMRIRHEAWYKPG